MKFYQVAAAMIMWKLLELLLAAMFMRLEGNIDFAVVLVTVLLWIVASAGIWFGLRLLSSLVAKVFK